MASKVGGPRIDRNTFDPRYFSKYFSRTLACACGLVAISTMNYAFDQQGFNSTQAMDSFERTFGKCTFNPKTKKTTCALET